MLHRARAEREEAGVDAVVLLAETHVVAHRLRLGKAGQTDRLGALEAAETRRKGFRLVEIDAGRLGMPDLEDERLDLRERLVAREGRMVGAGGGLRRGGTSLAVQHHRTSFKPATRAARSSSVLISVEATRR